MFKKKFIVAVLATLVLSSTLAQGGLKYRGFSGGMMVHTGYLKSNSFDLQTIHGNYITTSKVEGMPFGIGGAARLHFGKHLRVGGEGYVSNLRYGVQGTTSSVSWGGALVDCVWPLGRWWPFAGMTIGGGAVEHVILQNEPATDFAAESDAVYREYSFMALAPMVGVEYAMNEKIHLTFKADYVINLSNPQADFPSGLRFFLGFMFYRLDD
jgi:hypothetical protein